MGDRKEQPVEKNWVYSFFALWTGQAVSLLGSQLVQFALIWWLTKTTGSATVLAMASLVGLLPQILLGPITGALVDRWNRRWTMILADSLIALATAGLALLFWSGRVEVWHIYALMFLRSTAGGFHWAAMTASTSLLVPKQHLSRIQGFNQMLNGAMNIGAAPLGALLLGILPMQGVLAIDIGTALLAVLPLLFIRVPQPERSQAGQASGGAPSVWRDLGDGWRYVLTWPSLVLIMGMATLINLLLSPASALQPILVTRHFGGEALQLAWLQASWGLGVLLGGLTLGVWGGFRRRILTSMIGLLALGGAMTGVGLAPASALWLAVGLMFVVGFNNPLVNGPLFAVLQDVVAPEMQGRVFTLIGSLATAMAPLGLILAGPAADSFGVQTWFILGGALTALLGLAGLFIPAVMNIEEGRHEGGPVESVPVQADQPTKVVGD